MEEYRNPIHAAEPYEESQGKEDVSVASPDVLVAFYKDMERKEVKSSKKSNTGASIWSRKSVKRSATAHPASSPAHDPHQTKTSGVPRDRKRREEEDPVAANHHDSDKPDWILPMNSPRSIIPDSRDLPLSHDKDVWSSVPIPSHRVRYKIHRPVGPRWYKNHHLIPPSETTPAARPPSFFSASFPPIAASTSQDRLEDPTRIAGPSRTPSNSPLPTPNSSQTRVEDRPRTRKLSETAHDVVDLLDVTDPWGTNWHHHSPYDIGLVNGAISADVQDILQTRSRRSSMDQSRGRTVAPSPLSQSTSAINLQVKPEIHIPRKLSKRRAPTPVNANPESRDTGRHAVSLPTTPLDTPSSPSDFPKRMSVAVLPLGSSMFTQNNSLKKDKRGGVLGRLVKKFSLFAKPLSDPNKLTEQDGDWQRKNTLNPILDTPPRQSFAPSRQSSPEKPSSEATRRVPPPPVVEPVEEPVEESVKVPDTTNDVDSSSVASFEVPFSIGRLTITNPDSPGSGETTPAQGVVPLPPNKETLEETVLLHDTKLHPTFPPTPQSDTNPPAPPEKSPTPPTPLTKSSEEVVSEPPLASPIIRRHLSLEHQLPDPSSQTSNSLERVSSINESSASVRGSEVPGFTTEQSTSSTQQTSPPSPQNLPQSDDQPLFQPSQMLQPASSTSKKGAPVSVASNVPFPSEYNDSPLSAASVLANPPTPYTDHLPPPLPSKIPTDMPTRQTETFRLVRSPSGNIYSNEKIVAGGEHWEVVGAKRKSSSSLKERTPKDSEARSHERHHRDRYAKNGRDSKEYESRDRDYKRGTKVRDSRDEDHVRDSRDRDYRRDSRNRDSARDSKDRVYVHDSRDREYVRESRHKSHTRESRDSDYRDSRDRDYHRKSRGDYNRDSRDRYYGHDSRDRDYVRSSKDRDHVHDSRDHTREHRDRDKDYVRNHKIRDSSDRSQRDRESTNRLEKKRDSKAHAEPEVEADSRRRHRSQRDSKLGGGERSTTVPKAMPLGHESERHRRESAVQHDTKRNNHTREDPERKLTLGRHETFPANVNPSISLTLPTQNIPTSRPLGRHPSLSARPISQLPPADEINAIRAKEAWDMERLSKARSMHGDELNGYTTIPSNHNTPLMSNISPPVSTIHGSSHTAFVVQTQTSLPQAQHSIYHSMPVALPPIIYSSPSSIPTVTHQIPPTSHRQPRARIYTESVVSDQKSYTSARTTNPLPEVPRESPYEIPADARNSEYWTKYAGLAANTLTS